MAKTATTSKVMNPAKSETHNITKSEISDIVKELSPKYKELVINAVLKVLNGQSRYLANTLALTAKVRISKITGKTATSEEMDIVSQEIQDFINEQVREILNDQISQVTDLVTLEV